MAADSDIVVTFSADINDATVSASTFNVDGSLSGKIAGAYSTSNAVVTFNPTTNFKAGETVTVTLTTGIQSTTGSTLTAPVTWQFVVDASVGPAVFPTGVNFGTGTDLTNSVALGDVDGDGDLDIAAGNDGEQNVVYKNNGSGATWTGVNFGTGTDATYSVALGDVDGDGDLDIAVGNSGQQNVVYFNTTVAAPTVTTQAVSSIATTTAVGNGTVTSDGGSAISERGIVWGTSLNPTTSDSKVTTAGTTGVYSGSLSGLTAGTLYHVRAYASNAIGTSYGSDVTFTTYKLPAVTTQAVSGISYTTATGNGNVTDLGVPDATEHGVVWNTSTGPTTSDNKTTEGAVSATGAFTSSISGLSAGTTYYVRAYATNSAGTAYGAEVSFSTLSLAAPTVTTQAVSSITTTTAVGNGTVASDGGSAITERGIVWGTSLNPTTSDSKVTTAGTTGAYSGSLSGLTAGTMYHVRAYASNAIGTSYGSDVTFTTYKLPAVTTQAVSGISYTTATGNGNVTDLGAPKPTEHGVVWKTSSGPTTADSKTTDGKVSATGAFTSSISGLSPGTLYYVKAYATNSAGTVYGAEVSFITL